MFKWGSFTQTVEVQHNSHSQQDRDDYRQHHKRARGGSSGSSSSFSSSSSSVPSTVPLYLQVDTASGTLCDERYDIMSLPQQQPTTADSSEPTNPASIGIDDKLKWWGIRPEPMLLKEVSFCSFVLFLWFAFSSSLVCVDLNFLLVLLLLALFSAALRSVVFLRLRSAQEIFNVLLLICCRLRRL